MSLAKYQLTPLSGTVAVTSTPVTIDYLEAPFAVCAALIFNSVAGVTTPVVLVQVTLDDLNFASDAINDPNLRGLVPTWITVNGTGYTSVTANVLMTFSPFGVNGSANNNFPGPIRGIRWSLSGTITTLSGTVMFEVLQGQSPR